MSIKTKKRWCNSEVVMLEVVYAYIPNKILAERFGTTSKSIERKAYIMRLKKNPDVIIEGRIQTNKERYGIRKPIYKRGIKMIYCPNHPNATKNNHGRICEHILLMEEKLGRYLAKNEKVFHKDGNLLNNDIDNLYIVKLVTRDSINESELIQKRKSGFGVRQLTREYNLSSFTMYKILRDNDCVNKNIETIYSGKSYKPKLELEFLENWDGQK
jgi:hypothetical protein